MAAKGKAKRDWLEPPDWWKKWHPLRWLFLVVVLFWIYDRFVQPAIESHRAAQAQAQAKAAAEQKQSIPAPVPTVQPAIEQPKAQPVQVQPAAPQPPVAAVASKPPTASPVPPVQPASVQPKAPPIKAQPETQPTPAAPPVPAPAVVDPEAQYTAVVADRVKLMDSLQSYESVATVTGQLQKGGYTWKADQIIKPKMRHYPPFRTDTLVVAAYKDFGQIGELTLEFFNDRLYKASFSPAKPADYMRILRKQGSPLKWNESGRSEFTQGNLHVESNIDFASSEVGTQLHTVPYIYWRDERLSEQFKNWGPLP